MSTRKNHRDDKGVAEVGRKAAVESFLSRRPASRHRKLSLTPSTPIVFNRRAGVDQRAVNPSIAPVDRLLRPLPTLREVSAQWQFLQILESQLFYDLKTSKRAGLEGSPPKGNAQIDIKPTDGS